MKRKTFFSILIISLIDSFNCLFFRKFKQGISDLAIQGLDEWLLDGSRPNVTLHSKKFLIAHNGLCMVAWVQDSLVNLHKLFKTSLLCPNICTNRLIFHYSHTTSCE